VAETYLDFDLLIERAEQGYRARVLRCPAVPAACGFALPFSDLELENFLLKIGYTRGKVRRLESRNTELAKDFGRRLFEAAFGDEVRGCLRQSLDVANQQDAGLRLRLHLTGAPELADLPWEFLYDPALNRFFVLSGKTPLVRFLDLPERIRPLAVQPPLRVLGMISSPAGYEPLDVDREWAKLAEAVADLTGQGLVTVERLAQPTLAALQRRLRRGQYHIFHFVGHGAFDERAQDGVLLLEDEKKEGRPVSGQELGTLLRDHTSLRLAILNACEGGRASRTDPFAGTAQSLVQQGIPAVIAMQFEVADETAILFSREFYAAIADGYAVDAALAEARKAIFAADGDLEWATPVLYMRAPDGRIFDYRQIVEPQGRGQRELAALRAAEERRRVELNDLYERAAAAFRQGAWAEAARLCGQLLDLQPHYRDAETLLAKARNRLEAASLPPPPSVRPGKPTDLPEETVASTSESLRSRLRQGLSDLFSEEELRTLCFDLGVDYENLPGSGKIGKAREIVAYFERRSSIPQLITQCRRLRPNGPWAGMPELSAEQARPRPKPTDLPH
jgi:hypothetical protein